MNWMNNEWNLFSSAKKMQSQGKEFAVERRGSGEMVVVRRNKRGLGEIGPEEQRV